MRCEDEPVTDRHDFDDSDRDHADDSGAHPLDIGPDALGRCVREVVEFVDAAGWDQPPQMFALVPTALLAETEPELVDTLTTDAELTPVEQEPLPSSVSGGSPELDEVLATISWPEAVAGCALVQEIVVLPPAAEETIDAALLDDALRDTDRETADAEAAAADRALRSVADAHPERREARLVAATLRTGESLCLLQLRPDAGDDPDAPVELLQYEGLAPNLVHALHATFEDTEPW